MPFFIVLIIELWFYIRIFVVFYIISATIATTSVITITATPTRAFAVFLIDYSSYNYAKNDCNTYN